MAKRNKIKNSFPARSTGRLSTDISDAENGYIVNVSGETGGKKSQFFSKRYVAGDRPEAIRIASSCLAGRGLHKSGRKKGDKKKVSLKKS